MTNESRDIFDRIREEYTTHFIGETVAPRYTPGGRSLPPAYADLHLDAEARFREIHRLVGMGQIDDANALRAVQSRVVDRIHGVWADDRTLVGPLREDPMAPTELSNQALTMGKGLASGPKYALDAPPSPVVPCREDMLPWITKMLHVPPEGLAALQAELAEFLESFDI